MRFLLLIAILQLYSIQVQVLVACLAFLISHSPCHWILFLCMSETKRTSGPKPAASKISQGVACRHKCTSVGTRAAASVLLAEDLVWGRLGHLRIRRIWGMEFWEVCSAAGSNCALLYSLSLFFFPIFSWDCHNSPKNTTESWVSRAVCLKKKAEIFGIYRLKWFPLSKALFAK